MLPACWPLIEHVNALSVTVAALATALFVIVVTAREASSWPWRLLEAVTIPFRGPFQLAGDAFKALRLMKGRIPDWLSLNSLVAWIIPLAACLVFFSLFASANPLIEYRLQQIDLRAMFNLFSPARIGFWILLACAIWPLLLRRARRPLVWPSQPRLATGPSDLDHLFGVQAVTRSLILFNVLFALQSALDLTYLWGGATLPDGMTYAHYAHRGAYPLIATALLAAGFVLIAMRPGGPAEQSRLIRPLVLLWTGQNVLLVVSSIFRLDLYVAAYSLTYLRLAAFIWMGLVAVGLVLMLIQIITEEAQFLADHPPTPSRWQWCCTDAASSTRRGWWRPTMWSIRGKRRHRALISTCGISRRLARKRCRRLKPHVNKIPVLGPIARNARHNHEIRRRLGKLARAGIFGHGVWTDIWLTIPT